MQEKKPLAISELSQYYFYNCEKLIRLISDKGNSNKDNGRSNKDKGNSNKLKYKNNGEIKNYKMAIKKRGLDFELKVINELIKKGKDVINCNDDIMIHDLKNAKNDQIFYQMKFDVPDEFYDEMKMDNIKLGAFVPDFIEVKERDYGKKEIIIYDAKASKSTHTSHQFQVASYALLLEFIVKKISGLSISNTGGIFLPSSQSNTPFQLEKFRLDFFLPEVKKFFRNKLPEIINAKTSTWHYNSRCRTCDFVNVCRKDAIGSISMTPYLSLVKAEDLKTFISDRKSGNDDVDIEDVVEVIKELDIRSDNFSSSEKDVNRRIKHIVKYDKRLKSSPYLKAKETNQAQFIKIPTANFPRKTDHNLIITMSLDYSLSRPFAWGICLYCTISGRFIKGHRHTVSISKDKYSLKSFIELMNIFVTKLEESFKYLQENKSRACVFVYSDQEKKVIQDALLEIISMDESNISGEIQQKATSCLFNLFEDSSLLATQNNVTESSTKFPNISKEWKEWRDFPRLIILEHAISENIAIHVPGFYRFIDIWNQLVKPTLKDEYNFKDIEDIELENIFALWVSGRLDPKLNIINKLHSLRTNFVNATLRAYYKLLENSTNYISSILIFTPPIFTLTKFKEFKHNYLGKLCFFKQFEAITECNQNKYDRIRDFMQGEAVYGSKLKFEEFCNSETARFTLLSNNGKELESSLYKSFILVEDNSEAVLKAIQFSDMKYRADYSKSPLLLVDIFKVDDSDLQKKIYLKGTFSTNLKKEIKYRLYKRYYDYNLDRVMDTLTTMDKRNEHESVFMNLLKDPNKWALTEEVEQFKKIKLQMSPSQEEISKKILERRLQIVWGPPGSGKTHFLSLFTTWYLSEYKCKLTKNYIVGVTAFTRAAIENLLNRISTVQKQHHKTSDFDIIYLTDDSKKNHFNGIKKCRAQNLMSEIGINDKPIVIGGTVWDWFKVRKSWNSDWVGCDIMIIDEGSQLLVSDASIAIECLNPKTGKLIVAGDHMQFGPILRATYPTFPLNHPLIFGSILQCLMRKENGNVIHEENLILREGQKHNFGPLTVQLKENWRMNEKLNSFFQMIYGKDYKISSLKETKLLPSLLFEDPDSRIQRILSPDSAIILVKLMARNKGLRNNPRTLEDKFLQTEVEVVEKIYISINNVEETKKPSLLVVTPSHRQRIAIQSKLKRYPNINLQIIDTTEKMQGKEADIVITCFGFYNLDKTSKKEFVFKINRWNVATSRARSKVIIITTDKMLDPEDIEISINKKMREGRAFLNMIENWVQNNDNNIGEKRKRENIGIIKWTISGDEKKQRND
ncbi:unnamed protein product [Rhizophagus irregularis]|nr:unnamed protein product [Rhizophagus irregularis]